MEKVRNNPMRRTTEQPFGDCLKCGAKTRQGKVCKSPAMKNGRCRMHGGASTGAPRGNKNAWKHGKYSAHAALLNELYARAKSN